MRLLGLGGTCLPVGRGFDDKLDLETNWLVQGPIRLSLFCCPSREELVTLFDLDVGGLTFPVL